MPFMNADQEIMHVCGGDSELLIICPPQIEGSVSSPPISSGTLPDRKGLFEFSSATSKVIYSSLIFLILIAIYIIIYKRKKKG